MALCFKDKEDGERGEGQTGRRVCSDAWVAISASSASTSPWRTRWRMCKEKSAQQRNKEGELNQWEKPQPATEAAAGIPNKELFTDK